MSKKNQILIITIITTVKLQFTDFMYRLMNA